MPVPIVDASQITSVKRLEANIESKVGSTNSKPIQISSGYQAGMNMMTPPQIPNYNFTPLALTVISSITFDRLDLSINTDVTGNFTKDKSDSTTLDSGVNYRLYRVNVDANKTYRFNLTPSADADAHLFLGVQNATFTADNILAIANKQWVRSSPSTTFVYKKSDTDGILETVEANTTAAGFFDILILSYKKGSWSFNILGDLYPMILTGGFSHSSRYGAVLSEGANYGIRTITVEGNRTYDIRFSETSSKMAMFIGKPNSIFSGEQVVALANFLYRDIEIPSSLGQKNTFVTSYTSGNISPTYLTISGLTGTLQILLLPYEGSQYRLDIRIDSDYVALGSLVRSDLLVNTTVTGEFTKGNYSGALLSDKSYKLFRINVEANKTYNFNLTLSTYSILNLFTSLQNMAFTEKNVEDIERISTFNGSLQSAGVNQLPYIYKNSGTGIGTLIGLSISTTSAGFFDILIISQRDGSWSMNVS